MTTVYLIRHSKPLDVNNEFNNDELQLQNEKASLSIEGETIAREKFSNKEYKKIDVVFSSNYVRTIQTAKYLAEPHNLKINVNSDLGERRFGISSWDEKPSNFERKQFLDENYKIGDGESQKEVRERMYYILMKILDNNKEKRIAIISHGTAISYLLKVWCNVTIVEDKLRYSFNEKVLLNGYFNYCETFKLEFDNNNNLINIDIIK